MKILSLFITVSASLIIYQNTYSQQLVADSLINELNFTSGEQKVKILNELADIYQFIDTHEAIRYAEKGIELAKEIGNDKLLAGCYGSVGYAYINLDNSKAAEFTNKALEIRKKITDYAGIATSLNVLGVLHYYEGDYLESIKYHLEALKRREEIGDPIRTATSYNNIALVNIALENYEEALDYLNKGLKIRKETNNKRAIGIIKVNIGKIQMLMGETDQALISFNEVLKINKELGNHKSKANTYQNLASVFKVLKQYSTSINYYDSSLTIYNSLDEKNGIANVQNGLAEVYQSTNNYNSAINHSLIALENSNKINSLENKVIALKTLYTCFEQKSDFRNAFNYLSQHKKANEELKNDEKIKKLAKIELDYKLEQMRKEQEEKLRNQRLFIVLLVFILFLGTVIIFQLIRNSKQKRIVNEKLDNLNKKLNEANKTKDKFLSIIAHDLRGPYQTTLGMAQFLTDNFETIKEIELKENVKKLNRSLNNQYNLLNDLLKWAELQGGGFSLEKEKIKLSEIVNDLYLLLELTAKKKNITLKNKVNDNVIVYADKNMLGLVLRNLISNSIKFTDSNGKVEIVADIINNKIQICVEDTGIGISTNDIENLFKIDIHHTNRGTSNEEGSGLGLILCKEIVEKHNGTIWVNSEKGKGSKFFFAIPIG